MELHLIERHKPKYPRCRAGLVRTMYFGIRNKHIMPSKLLAENCDMHVGSKLLFAFNEQQANDVFFSITENTDIGCLLCLHRKETGKLVATSASIVNHIQHISKAKKSVSYLVARKPVMIDGRAWYKLLTNKPYHIN